MADGKKSDQYKIFYDTPEDIVLALVVWDMDGRSVERMEGRWVPMDDLAFLSLEFKIVDTMSEGIVEVFDKADLENRDLTMSDVQQFVIPRAER
jgi:hypothetical protein